MEFDALAESLYAGVPEDFTVERTAAEKAAKAAKDSELASKMKALRKPSLGAWAVNLLVRWEADQISDVFTLAEQLRAAAASLDGEELRQLTRQRRQLTAALTTRARQLALEHGQRITPSVAEQIEDTLTAAMLDAGVAAAVRSGLLVTTCRANGLDEVDPIALVAYPEALGHVAPRAEQSTRPLHAVPDSIGLRRAAARDEVKTARAQVEEITSRLRQAQQSLGEEQARVMEVRGRLEELRREVTELELQAERAEAAAEEAADEVESVNEQVLAAQRQLDAAEASLAALS